MVAILIAYVSYAYLTERSRAHMPGPEEATASGPQPSLASPLFLVAAGLAGLALGAYLLVDGASGLARYFGVSEAAIGLTVVAFGTSLPELAASVVAALRRHPEVVIGNVVGSNAFNILGNLGLTAVIAPIPISARFLAFDGPVLMASAAIVLLAIAFTGRIGRIGGAGLLAAYVLYIAFTLQ